MSSFAGLRGKGHRKYAQGKRAVAICDRCGWKYLHSKLSLEPGTELLVCNTCNDGSWNRVTHPLNFPARLDEAIAIKNPRPDIIDPLPPFLSDDPNVFILDENGQPIFVNDGNED